MSKIVATRVTPVEAQLELRDVPLSVANGLRRACLVELPGVAIDPDSVSFSQDEGCLNSTSVDDEVLASRLALLPVLVDPAAAAEYELLICDRQQHDLPFENTGDAPRDYMTTDMVLRRGGKLVPHEQVFKAPMLLTMLKPGQRLRTACKLLTQAPKGAATQGMAWSPCWVTRWEYLASKQALRLLGDQYKYDGHEVREPRNFGMTVTTEGYYHRSAHAVVADALGVLLAKCERLASECQTPMKGGYVPKRDSDGMLQEAVYMTVEEHPAVEGLTTVHMYSEDDTIGHLLVQQLQIVQAELGDSAENFVAYEKTPYSELILKIRNDPQRLRKKGVQVLDLAAHRLSDTFKDLQRQWSRQAKNV